MMLDWNEYQKELLSRISEIGKLRPDTVRGYQALSVPADRKMTHFKG